MIKRIAAVVLFMALFLLPAAAAEANDSYVLDGLTRVAVPEMYEFSQALQVFAMPDGEKTTLKNPQDVFINGQGHLFIADSGNNRIVKAETNGTVLAVFTSGNSKEFNNPQGVFADNKGNMYIADTDNSRIVHLDQNGDFVEEFGVPDEMPDDDQVYYPAKIAVSSTGYIYVVRGQNILILDASNRFRGYLGQSQIGFNMTETLIRMFASEEQKATRIKRLAASYINIAIDPDNNLYATTQDYTAGEIKKLNSVGTNVYRSTGASQVFSINLSEMFLSNSYISSGGTAFYGDRKSDTGENIKPYFSDIAFDESGVVYALEKNTCRVFIYDREGNLLGTFGSNGLQKGKFVAPSSLVIDKNENLYILDSNLGNLQVFTPTQFKTAVCQAIDVYFAGKYQEAHGLWQEVLSVNENYTFARKGIGKTYFKEGNYAKSMEEFRRAGDVTGYSDAFAKAFYHYFRENFALVIVLAALALAAVGALIFGLHKLSKNIIVLHDTRNPRRLGYTRSFQLAASALFHPCDTFDNIKYMRGGIKPFVAPVIALSAVAVRLIYMNIVHFPLADIDLRNASYLLEGVKLLLPFFTFVLSAYAVTAIMNGETKFDEMLLSCSLCLMPYIVLTLPMGAVSYILTAHDASMYSAVQSLIMVWMVLLFFNAIRVSNRFSFKKTLLVAVISLLVMALIWILGALILVMWNQVYLFITDVLRELTGTNR